MTKKKTNKVIDTTIENEAAIAVSQVNKDIVVALLIVSLVINLFILTAWVTLQVTSAYDNEVAAFLFTR